MTKAESQAITDPRQDRLKAAFGIGPLASILAENDTTRLNSWHRLLLGDILKDIHLRSSVLFRPEFGAPWGVRFDASTGPRLGITDPVSVFHIVAQGCCWLSVKGVPEPVLLSSGDFAVFTHGDAHTLRDAPDTPAINFSEAAKRRCAPGIGGAFRSGGEGALTKFVCGGMHFEDAATNPLITLLPPYLHLRATEQNARPCLGLTVKHILAELESDDPGAADIVTRLTDILFILAVRSYFEQNADGAQLGWLAAARDQRIGPALALLHGQPHKPWTIESLSHHLAMSRSTFADKFTMLVGEPPLRYLTRVRINAAARRMRSSEDGLSAIAAGVGYESFPAFTRAFKRYTGMTPGMYRKATRTRMLL